MALATRVYEEASKQAASESNDTEEAEETESKNDNVKEAEYKEK